jgi:hypothetical protein
LTCSISSAAYARRMRGGSLIDMMKSPTVIRKLRRHASWSARPKSTQ